ncbi:MAG: TolC family outer membrane protein [Thalassobaculaceae bacterium]
MRWASAFLVSVAVWSVPPAATAQSLREALEAAYTFSPELAAERARTRSTDENVFTAQGAWLPTVTLTGTATQSVESTKADAGTTAHGGTSETSGSLTVSYTLYNGGSRDAELRQAREQSGGARADLMTTEQRVLADTAIAYVDVLVNRRLLTAQQDNLFELQDFLDRLETLVESGQRTAFDIADTRIHIGETLSDIAAQQQVVDDAEARFRRFVGSAPAEVGDYPEFLDMPQTEGDAVASALADNPEVLSAKAAVRAAEEAVRVAKAGRLPTVDVSGSVNREDVFTAPTDSAIGTAGESTYGAVELSVSVPLFQAGTEFSAIRQAKQTANAERLSLKAIEERVRQETSTAWSQLAFSQRQVSAAESRLDAATFSVDALRRRLEEGRISLLDALDVNERYIAAQTALLQAHGAVRTAEVRLLQAIGRFGAGDLQLDVTPYDPDEYYRRISDNLLTLDVDEAR